MDSRIQRTTFRDQKNISGLKSVELQGEDLRTKIRRNYQGVCGSLRSCDQCLPEVWAGYVRVRGVGHRFCCDPGGDRSCPGQTFVFDSGDDTRDPVPRGDLQLHSAISLEVKPDHGAYGDTLSMAGDCSGSGWHSGQGLRGRSPERKHDDRSGRPRFSFPYRVDQIAASNPHCVCLGRLRHIGYQQLHGRTQEYDDLSRGARC